MFFFHEFERRQYRCTDVLISRRLNEYRQKNLNVLVFSVTEFFDENSR